jgi:hypothetical protein
MGGTYGSYGRDGNACPVKNFGLKMVKGREHLGGVAVDGIILK